MNRPVNRADIVASVSKDTDLPANKAGEAVDAMLAAVLAALGRGQEVRLTGFGSFAVATRKAAKGRHPRTGEPMDIAASNSVRFKPGKGLKDAVSAG